MRTRHGGRRRAGGADIGMAAVAALAATGVGIFAVSMPTHASSGTGRTAAAAAAGNHTTDPGPSTSAPISSATSADATTLQALPLTIPTSSDPASATATTVDALPTVSTTVPSPSRLQTLAQTATPGGSDPAASAAPTTAAPSPAPAPATTTRSGPQSAQTFAGVPTAGVLYYTDKSLADHFCSASVVHSPAGDLAVTAAHCVYNAGSDAGAKTGIVFVPGYHNGESPYGQWTPSRILVAPGWSNSGDVNGDVAFLVLNKSSSGASVESVTGADQIAFNQGFGQSVTIPAYPDGATSPITCTNTTTSFSSTQTEFDCDGYPDGTSGAPFLTGVNGTGNQGTVIGVIGGYQQGGDTPAVSYSSYFGNDISALYQAAVAAG